jgi:thioredoxin-related protein
MLTLGLSIPASGLEDIKWYNYNEGIALGRIEKKKVFMHFYADWCIYCKKMANETFQYPAVVAYLNKNFIAIRVNFDKEGEIVSRYGIQGIPSTWFLTQTGEIVRIIPGYIPPKPYCRCLKKCSWANNEIIDNLMIISKYS